MANGMLDSLVIFGILFGFLFGSLVLFYGLNVLGTALNNATLNTIITSTLTGWSYSDYVVVIFIIFIFVLNFLSGFIKSSNPLLVFLAVLFQLFGVILAVNVQYVFDAFFQTTTVLTTYLANFPFTLIVLNNVVLVYLLMSSGYFIGLFGKRSAFQ